MRKNVEAGPQARDTRLQREWSSGDYLTHRFNPELGIGRIVAREGRALVVEFPRAGRRLRLAADTDVLHPVDLGAGRPVRLLASGERTVIVSPLADGRLQLANGRVADVEELWPLELERSLLERLAAGDADDVVDVGIRLDALRLQSIREARGLGSFLGGRVRLFPHQLYVAERATAADPVRWLLADEVGLGKTIEAALILNRLVHTGRVERVLVVAPQALTVQWLGELWRKYHQVFTLLDGPRLSDVARDFGPAFNPFELHPRSVVALEMLVEHPQLTSQATAAGIDLLIVDEAQRLRRPPGHPGEPAWRAVAPIARLGRHVLLLSATPLEDDAHGFFRLLQLLRPDEFPEEIAVEARLASGVPLPACTSSTRRTDIGGLPPRVGMPVHIDDVGSAKVRQAVESRLRAEPAANAVASRQKVDRIQRALASGAALRVVLRADEGELRHHADAMDGDDPRVRWLTSQARRWHGAGEKTLVFVAHRETLEMLRTALSQRVQLASGAFHEELSPARRDTEVARFRDAEGPSVLVSTECGGEGRNFEFCRRLVLFDLPWNPSVVEQRIGRLDRIGRRIPVEIVYFRPPGGIGADAVTMLERLGVFREPLAGLEPHLAHVERALEDIAIDPAASLTGERLEAVLATTRATRNAVREAAYRQLHRDAYRAELAPAILARLPADLDALIERVVVTTAERLGFGVERLRGRRRFAIEFGAEALVDSLPGVPAGLSFVGTFDREEAVEDESIDFLASGHKLVEALLAHIDERAEGRVARLALSTKARGRGVVAVYKDGVRLEVVARDEAGTLRPEWDEAIRRGSDAIGPMREADRTSVDWPALVTRLSRLLDPTRTPVLVAAIVAGPAR